MGYKKGTVWDHCPVGEYLVEIGEFQPMQTPEEAEEEGWDKIKCRLILRIAEGEYQGAFLAFYQSFYYNGEGLELGPNTRLARSLQALGFPLDFDEIKGMLVQAVVDEAPNGKYTKVVELRPI